MAITFWVIYDHPKDFPTEFVGRRQYVDSRGQVMYDNRPFARGQTIDEVRAKVPYGCWRFERSPEDDPVIAETWME